MTLCATGAAGALAASTAPAGAADPAEEPAAPTAEQPVPEVPGVPEVPEAHEPQAPFPIPLQAASVELATVEALMDDAIAVVESYWTYALAPFGLGGPVGVQWVTPEEDGLPYACGTMSARASAGYCPADDTIYISDLFALGVWASYSDVAVVAVLAHEYGHHLQAQAGILAVRTGPGVELHADCLAGWWLRAVSDAGGLGEGGYAAAETFFAVLGDDEVGADDHHGTPSERAGAFRHGFESQVCPIDNF